MGTHKKMQEELKVQHGIKPQSCHTANYDSPWFSLKDANRALFVIGAGVVTANVVCTIRQRKSVGTGGSGTTNMTAKVKTITTALADTTQILEVDAAELDVANGFDQVSLRAAAAGAGALLSVSVIREPKHVPSSLIT
jgi:hypothetical protein